jgi:hypothetical protein
MRTSPWTHIAGAVGKLDGIMGGLLPAPRVLRPSSRFDPLRAGIHQKIKEARKGFLSARLSTELAASKWDKGQQPPEDRAPKTNHGGSQRHNCGMSDPMR